MSGRCLLHGQPMKLSAANMAILKNMSDLMTRELWGAYEDSYKQRILQLKKVRPQSVAALNYLLCDLTVQYCRGDT